MSTAPADDADDADESGSAALPRVFPGDGEMAARMRAFPWEETDVGAPSGWSEGLRAAVQIVLTSRFPMIVWWGADLRFMYNDAYIALMGSKHPGLWKTGPEVWGEIWHIVGPMLESVLATGTSTWSEDLLLPMDRHGYWEETYWTYSYSPLYDDDGDVRGVFTAVTDTTEGFIGQRRLAVLRELGAQAGKTTDVTTACRLVMDVLARSTLDVPFAALYLRDPGTGQFPAVTATPEDGTDWWQPERWPVEQVFAEGAPLVVRDLGEQFDRLPTGGWKTTPTEAVVLPLFGATGADPIGVLVLGASAGRKLDRTYENFLYLIARQTAGLVNAAVAYQAQQHKAEELAELDRAKTAFFSNISHEFRTPLTLMMGPVQHLRDMLSGSDQQVLDELDLVHRNGLRLGKLVNTLLDFASIEAGRVEAHYEPVDLAAVTAELAGLFRSAVSRAGLRFTVDCPPLAEPVHVDRGMWEKVILNLLSNAVKFTFEGGITLRVSARGDHAVVTVSDTGIGIPVAEMPRLFERFHRIPSAQGRSNEGSGIGLALVQELVHLHGGTIDAESTEGEGTTFTLTLPFGSAHLPRNSVATGHEDSRTATDPADPYVQEALRWLPDDADAPQPDGTSVQHAFARVLIADDNADMRDYLTRLLAPGYAVTAVGDGQALLDRARTDLPDLVISDIMMPKVDGLAALAALRASPRTAGIPVVLLSARAGQEAAVAGLRAGADDYLVKPFSSVELLARVRTTIELSRLRNRQNEWRTAMVDSLQEGFFVCRGDGTVIEVNAAFDTILGFGPEGLPYRVRHPWLPDAESEPEAEQQARTAFATLLEAPSGTITVPVTHRDRHRVWVRVTFSRTFDPDTGEQLIVGTFRDITAEHYAVQREGALSALGWRLVSAGSLGGALAGAMAEFRALWHAKRVLAATYVTRGGAPTAVYAGEGDSEPADRVWADVAPDLREAADRLRDRPFQLPVSLYSEHGDLTGITIDHPLGRLVLVVDLGGRRRFSREDETLLALLAGHLAQGLRRAQEIDQQRETALALQHAILGPAHLPPRFAVHYEPASPPLEIGGDWYDVVTLTDGRIGIVVGDCVGHGLAAATVMGQLRSACHAMLLHTADPAGTLTALDGFARDIEDAWCTSVFCAVLDPVAAELVYSNAGHPPGLVAKNDGVIEVLTAGHGAVLGVVGKNSRSNARTDIGDAAALLLYTDGLVERRGRPFDAGVDQASALLAEHRARPAHEIADLIMTAMAPRDGFTDDVAMLVVRPPTPLRRTFHAAPDEVGAARGVLRAWLADNEVPHQQAEDVLLAVGEACTNSVEHAYPPDRPDTADFTIEGKITGRDLTISVADHGAWRKPDPAADPFRGRGIVLMRAVMDEVELGQTTDGTTVTMRVLLDYDTGS
ncbi:SpoIIE family protein phosphatase [Labedaea rhizosphaerae]|uniref:histidine kinase n=1 Tax=Labedaea rhizosphaerae TaxID=598644 RepID=A0A4V3CZT1_LABRH|nr:SpoIIE family protein phosphatase [Labedaea rhizosphaerae]TDQ00941.1 PAS domain S-box-containing protein [Labedaea rhizosphaerae]